MSGQRWQAVQAAVLGLAVALTSPAAADVAGIVTAVHDGDTFSIGAQRVRIFGIDAPELRQMCSPAPGQCAPCGDRARQALSDLILGKPLTCRDRGRSYDRVVAECSVDGAAVGPAMLERGWAVTYDAFLRKGDRTVYRGAQERAKASGAGIWALEWVLPADWRNRRARLECER